MRLMAHEIGIDVHGFERLYVWRRYGKRSLRERADYDCVFLEGNHDRCAIYRSRPHQCRSFPFWPEVLESEWSWKLFSKTCPGMDRGELHGRLEIESYLS
jgi:Fe-S-cluster containining protein